ncbi:Predicted dienelactone hydrolase [Paenibacillus uliginis N3/975]|uniref:Predicted dienelactone hydrolase n=1 Tax=Paenibacillus uliginis N3/975 TaxID=1313296 RepID=A0A1X7HEP4_9BACL|nr:acetylhydrolase [Paenibacillus uliginis]SMF85236.1 Predicted dienelactone hydrolase [Paenibacillus uliginis N3/975]
MRIMEVVLVTFNVVMLLWLVVGQQKSRQLLWGGLAVSAVLLVVQGWVDGWRWPLIPAYALTLAPLWALLLDIRRRARSGQGGIQKRGVRRIAALLSAFFYGTVTVAAPLLLPVFTFDEPAGPYGIGTVAYHWIDNTRKETSTLAAAGAKRELKVQIWYPASKDAKGTRAPYVPDSKVYTEAFQRESGLPQLFLTSLGQARTHAIKHAVLSDAEAAYPVLIFSHGFGGFEGQNMFQVEQLVSHGYIVAGINHTYDSMASIFPDGRVALYDSVKNTESEIELLEKSDRTNEVWVNDVRFVLDQLEQLAAADPDRRFTGRMDMKRLGMFGHSFGGATTVQMLLSDPRVRSGINMDGALYGERRIPAAGINKPFLMISSDEEDELAGSSATSDDQQAALDTTHNKVERYNKELNARYAPVKVGGNYWLKLHNTLHMSFSDFFLISPIIEWAQGVNARETHRLVNDFTLDFFNHYLKGQPLQILNNAVGTHDDYILEKG